jgi:hypothetical protein
MMGGGAFILLKARYLAAGSAKQAEICLAGLPKILHIAGSTRRSALAEGAVDTQ